MKTEVYTFDKENMEHAPIRALAEKSADYNELTNKQRLRLLLLTEELTEMLPNLLNYGAGEFWIENNDRYFEIHVVVKLDSYLTENEMRKVLAVSRTGNNSAAVGILNKIRIVAETMAANYSTYNKAALMADSSFYEMGTHPGAGAYLYQWSLQHYKDSAERDKTAWDELEKSIIANLADDVLVGVIKGKAEIIVKKWFDRE